MKKLALLAIISVTFLVASFSTATLSDAFVSTCTQTTLPQPLALWKAICDLQQQVNGLKSALNAEKTTRQAADTNLQNQINSFFDVFVELGDTANKQCPNGEFVIGTGVNGEPLCGPDDDNDDALNQRISDLEARVTTLENQLPGDAVCGNGIVESGESCDDGNSIDGDGCSSVCTVENGLCSPGDTSSCYTGPSGTQGIGQCSNGIQTCDLNSQWGVCTGEVTPSVEVCDGVDNDCNGIADDNPDLDTNPVCTSATDLSSVSGDIGSESRQASGHGEKWWSITIREDSVFQNGIAATITLDSGTGNDYDLFVYCSSCGNAPIGSSALGPGQTDLVSVTNDDPFFGEDNTFTVLIEVRAVSVTTCSDYTLTINGNTAVGTPVSCP